MIENQSAPIQGNGTPSRSRFHLDGVHPDDYPALFRWMNDLDELPLWTVRRKPLLPADLVQHIENRTRGAFFVIIRHGTSGEAVGFVDATIRERHEVAEFECYIAKEWRARGAVIALGELFPHLFGNWPVRKLYCQAFAYNDESIRILTRIGLEEAGRFKEFAWRDDRFWDLIVFCVEREKVERALHGGDRVDRRRAQLFQRARTVK